MRGTFHSAAAAVREAWSALALQGRELAERAADRLRPENDYYRPRVARQRSPVARRLLIGTGAVVFAAIVSCGLVWWQLSTGPVAINFVTPWLTSAIEQKLGGQHRVEVGGTVLEYDEAGRSALRLRNVVVRDAQGTVIASAPKAEVGVSSFSFLSGQVQTERLSLIGAEMALRIEPNGEINVLAGMGRPALAVTPAATHSIAPPAMASTGETVRVPAGRGFGQPAYGGPCLDRSARFARPRWRFSRRNRPEGLYVGRRGSAQWQALELRAHQSQPDASSRRRCCARGQLDRSGWLVVGDRDRDTKARRPPYH